MKLKIETLAVTSFDVGAPAQVDEWSSCFPDCAQTDTFVFQQDTVLV
ncbi:MAG TPA: hypothetical protein VHG91_19360 [Longimicrobium sp.]|nr:hypothetical protein [Longimicrobium sp.]